MHLFLLSTLFSVAFAGFGRSNYNQQAGQNAVNEIQRHENIALWSAQSAVASAVGRDYANQISTTTQFTNQFTAPVTKQQTNEAFNAVRHQQQGSLISGALANAQPAISRAGETAAKENFDQAYAQAEGDRLHGSFHDQQQREGVYLAGSALAAQQINANNAARYADSAKTGQVQTNANAIQAIHGITNTDRGASYGK